MLTDSDRELLNKVNDMIMALPQDKIEQVEGCCGFCAKRANKVAGLFMHLAGQPTIEANTIHEYIARSLGVAS